MRMHVLSGGRLRLKKRIYFPDAASEETIDVPVASFLIRHAQANVLFDTGCHPAVFADGEARWGSLTKVMRPIGGPAENVIDGLRSIGVMPDDIDVVACSHLHPDHCGCNSFFTRATVVCHAGEIAAARSPGAERAGYLAAEWDHPQQFDAIERERDLFDDGRIVLIPLPGHTPGTVGALVNLDYSGSFLIASDAVSLRAHLDSDLVPRNTWNVELLRRSLAEIRRLEANGATVICGHDDGQWQSLKKGADAYQ
jgi:N-acyl homoserine lactone hydrolase